MRVRGDVLIVDDASGTSRVSTCQRLRMRTLVARDGGVAEQRPHQTFGSSDRRRRGLSEKSATLRGAKRCAARLTAP